jgi:hypothetical protein
MVTAGAGTFAFVAWVPWVVWRLHLCAHAVWGLAGLGWQSIRETRERACKALLFVGGVQVGLVPSVRFGFRPGLAGGWQVFPSNLFVLLESCCVGYVCLVRNGLGLFPACFLAYRLFPARALAAARRFLYARHEACEQQASRQAVIMGIETWRRVRLFALTVFSLMGVVLVPRDHVGFVMGCVLDNGS